MSVSVRTTKGVEPMWKSLIVTLGERSIYVVTVVAGTLIILYGQVLVPWVRGSNNALMDMMVEFEQQPLASILTFTVAFLFPFSVGVCSSTLAQYRMANAKVGASLSENKFGSAFRVARNGKIVGAGTLTGALLKSDRAQMVQEWLGDKLWRDIASGKSTEQGCVIYVKAWSGHYVVNFALTVDNHINLYLTRAKSDSQVE